MSAHRRFSPPLALLACAFLPSWAMAQQSTTRGLNLGFHFEAASLNVEDGGRNRGGGAGFRVGYGVNRIVTLFLELDGATVDVSDGRSELTGTWAIAHGDAGVRFHFANSLRSFVPYLEVALTGRGVSIGDALVGQQDTQSLNFSGGALSLGGGLAVHLTRRLALDFSLKRTSGEFTEVGVGSLTVGGLDIDAVSTRLNVGLVWWR